MRFVPRVSFIAKISAVGPIPLRVTRLRDVVNLSHVCLFLTRVSPFLIVGHSVLSYNLLFRGSVPVRLFRVPRF